MALTKLWTIAWRDLGRNKRRSFFSILAVGLGLALLIEEGFAFFVCHTVTFEYAEKPP